MNYYSNRNATADRIQRSRKKDGVETNSNGNNCNDKSKGIDSYLNNYTRSTGEYSHRGSNRSNGPRKKSALVESMAANFEQMNKDSSVTNSVPLPVIKSPSYTRVETPPPASPKTPVVHNNSKLENGTTNMKYLTVDDEESTPPPRPKSSSSARRGKQQREKRMLRQKRRSTGVVRLPGPEDESSDTKKETEKDFDNETEQNTISNESNHQKKEEPHEIDELRKKLATAESTVAKLTKEIATMDSDLLLLERENEQLKKENKMLEDENNSMLMVLGQLRGDRK